MKFFLPGKLISAKQRSVPWPGFILLIALVIFLDVPAQDQSADLTGAATSKLGYGAYEFLDLPELTSQLAVAGRGKPGWGKDTYNADPVVIAVVDDAFRLSHKDLADFIYVNPLEQAGNSIDDDGNGKTDDISGWDLSDNDSNVYPPQGREEQYFHGTFITGTIVTLLQQVYGDDASKMFKILPVKVLSDHEQVPFLKDGYKGISYAVAQGADVICCAWSGGEATEEEREIIAAARSAGIALIGSAGNAYSEKVDNPAALDGVLAIAGLDTMFRKTRESNYGAGVNLVAPASKIRAAHPLADNAYFYGAGTSGAAGLVTGCIAVLKSVQREAAPEKLYEALINTATPVDRQNSSFSGKLGAGIPALEKAVRYLTHPEMRGAFFNSERTRGTLYLEATGKENIFEIRPMGAFSGFDFTLPTAGRQKPGSFSAKQHLSFYSADTLIYSSSLDQIPARVFVPGSSLKLAYEDHRIFGKTPVVLTYAAVPIDSSTLFCSGTSRYTLPSGEITDGSGEQDYANNSSCMWQITVEEGKQVSFRFTDFDTEAAVDFVYLFDGESSIPGNLIAKFSGPGLPPAVTSRTNSVLVWFVTDGRHTGSGWTLKYTATPGP